MPRPLSRTLTAPIVALLVAAPAGFVPRAAAAADDSASFLVSFGPDYGAGTKRAWREGFATFEYRSGRRLWRGIKPVYSFAVSREGAMLGAVGLYGGFRLGPVEITPHFSVGLYQDGIGGFDAKELLQFRSGIDALVPLSDTVSLGLGIYHVSNADITRRSADLDVARLSIVWRN